MTGPMAAASGGCACVRSSRVTNSPITLPKNPKWSRAEQEPRPVLIPVAGHEEDSTRAIRVYAAESNDPKFTPDTFKRAFLQGWFARPEYFGQAARLTLDEHVPLDWSNGIMTHFTITAAGLKYRGLSMVAGSPYGNYGFACVFREEDAGAAASICDGIVKSARYQELQPSYIHKVYPPYQSPPQYYRAMTTRRTIPPTMRIKIDDE